MKQDFFKYRKIVTNSIFNNDFSNLKELTDFTLEQWIENSISSPYDQEQWLYTLLEHNKNYPVLENDRTLTYQKLIQSLRSNSKSSQINFSATEITKIKSLVSSERIYNEETSDYLLEYLKPVFNDEQVESFSRGLNEMSFEVKAVLSAIITSIPKSQLKLKLNTLMLEGIEHLLDESTSKRNRDFSWFSKWWQAVRQLAQKFDWLWLQEKAVIERITIGTSYSDYGLLPRYFLVNRHEEIDLGIIKKTYPLDAKLTIPEKVYLEDPNLIKGEHINQCFKHSEVKINFDEKKGAFIVVGGEGGLKDDNAKTFFKALSLYYRKIGN